MSVAIPQPVSPTRAVYLETSRRLEERLRLGRPVVDEEIDLSEAYLRLGRYHDAVALLEPAALSQRNFMVLANLGTAYQLSGQDTVGLLYLQKAVRKDSWPTRWPGWSEQQLAWCRRAEEFQQRLLSTRIAESRSQAPGRARPAEAPDDLFGVTIEDTSGRYQAAGLSAAQQRQLPSDAEALVQQLLVWLPADTRLYWLLGELLRARGDVEGAFAILDECAWARGYDSASLRAHRQVLQEARAVIAAQVAPPATEPDEAPSGWRFNAPWVMAVGGGAALLVAGLLYLQVREQLKRHRGGSRFSRGGS
jgi:tetratricopeptide (TPR) repeat protein